MEFAFTFRGDLDKNRVAAICRQAEAAGFDTYGGNLFEIEGGVLTGGITGTIVGRVTDPSDAVISRRERTGD